MTEDTLPARVSPRHGLVVHVHALERPGDEQRDERRVAHVILIQRRTLIL